MIAISFPRLGNYTLLTKYMEENCKHMILLLCRCHHSILVAVPTITTVDLGCVPYMEFVLFGRISLLGGDEGVFRREAYILVVVDLLPPTQYTTGIRVFDVAPWPHCRQLAQLRYGRLEGSVGSKSLCAP